MASDLRIYGHDMSPYKLQSWEQLSVLTALLLRANRAFYFSPVVELTLYAEPDAIEHVADQYNRMINGLEIRGVVSSTL